MQPILVAFYYIKCKCKRLDEYVLDIYKNISSINAQNTLRKNVQPEFKYTLDSTLKECSNSCTQYSERGSYAF